MKIKLTIAALVLAASPAVAIAQGCGGAYSKGQQAAMSCLPGTTFDPAANTCVAEATS